MKKKKGSTCPIERVAVLLSDSWTMLIVRDLIDKKARFTDLASSLSPISTRTLTLKLKYLIDEDIVSKSDTSYILTAKGKKLGTIFEEMYKYGTKYLCD